MTSIPTNYNYSIVFLSILIAIFASFTTIELIGIARSSLKNKRRLYILVAALTARNMGDAFHRYDSKWYK